MKVTLAQPADFAAILQLQSQFHVSALPESELAEGFVTTELDPETLTRMHQQRALWVAKSGDEMAAYACAVEWEFYIHSRFVEAVFERFPLPFDEREVTSANSFIYGPTCIAPAFRGSGLLTTITDAMRARYALHREFGVCFIDVRNERSLAAHERKLGFRRIAQLPFSDVIYHMLAFQTA